MDLNKILKDLDENNKKNKSIDDSFIYSLLIDEEYLIQLNSLILKSDKYCINFLLNDIINTFDYEKTILYKLIRFSIKNSEYVDYIFLIKKIIKNESFLKYIENTDLWFVNIDTEFNYLENEQFLNTIFGCLWKKNLNINEICNDLFIIFNNIFNTNETWKELFKWIWNIFKSKQNNSLYINYDNNIDYFLFYISSTLYKIMIENYDKFHFKNIKNDSLLLIDNVLNDSDNIDIINSFNSKKESIIMLIILSINISFIPMKYNYINILNQETIIENQIINITQDFSMIYESTKINLLNKWKSELNKNKLNINRLIENIHINDYLHYTLLISEYFTYLILKKINFNHFNNIFGATFIEITSDIINFNISYNDKIKINDYPWEDFIELSTLILKNPTLSNNNPHIRFSFLEVLCYASFDMFVGRNNINEKIKNEINNLHMNMIPTHRNNLKTIMKKSNIFKNLLKDSFQLYIDIDNLGEDLQYILKPKSKYDAISLILNLINNSNDYKENLKNIITNENLLIIKVVNIILNDISNNLDDIFSLAETIYTNYSKNVLNIMSYFENVNNLMKTVMHYIDLIMSIQEITLEPFVNNIIFQKIIETLNYYFSWTFGNNPDIKKYENISKIYYLAESISTFNIKLLKTCLLHIMINLSKNDLFNKLMIQDKRSFNITYFEDEISQYIYNYSNKKIKILPKFISKPYNSYSEEESLQFISKLKDTISKEENASVEPPEVFLDPIGCMLMDDPVTLPSSNIVLDRTIIIKHLLNTSNDPFTRENLTINDLDEFNNQTEISEKMKKLKEEIINWKKNTSY
jgi:hypothetical protein